MAKVLAELPVIYLIYYLFIQGREDRLNIHI
jgi:hypothetical protein